jgi:mRNA interferase RelE/StbE
LAWRIELTDEARKQLKKIGQTDARRIRDFLRQRIEPLDDPRQLGKGLRGNLSQLWRYRVGDYRIVCELRDQLLVILIIRIGHRKNVYQQL